MRYTDVIQLLQVREWEQTENVSIAKGRYKYPSTFKELFSYIKKELKWLRK